MEEKDLQQEVPASAQQTPEDESSKQQLLRITADFANYRRRMEKERIEWTHAGQMGVIKAMLPVFDDIERAFKAAETAAVDGHTGFQAVREGLALVERHMKKTLEELGVREVPVTGAFDPHFHEALMHAPVTEGVIAGSIVQVFSKGYMYKDIVVRHAKVAVAGD